ncbi:MAG: hypothetical protein JKY37_07385 [Nannocystaceae bacterium]|nr:hypothetical protein [Nannocystaceae bacterium]
MATTKLYGVVLFVAACGGDGKPDQDTTPETTWGVEETQGDDGQGPAGDDATSDVETSGVTSGAADAAESSDTGINDTGDASDTTNDDGSTGDTPPLPGEVPLEGYGTLSTFGQGGDECVVTTLNDSGPGTLRDCIENRGGNGGDPEPRVILFEVGGTINVMSDIRVRQPYLTVDGLSAPAPGITIEKSGNGTEGEFIIGTWPGNQTCGHDVLVQGLRFQGVWAHNTEDTSNNAGTIGLDGEDLPLCLHHVVLNRITVLDAQDAAGDIWGSASDITVQYSAFLDSLHPSTYSHSPGGENDQQRERLSNHHNLYANFHERGPQVRGDNRDSNFEQNIVHRWAAFGFGGGYGMRLRCRDNACPQRLNVSHNHFTGASDQPQTALIIGEQAGADADEMTLAPQVYMEDNWRPATGSDQGTAPASFDRAAEAEVTIYTHGEVVALVLPNIGAPYRTAYEDMLFEEVGAQLDADHR